MSRLLKRIVIALLYSTDSNMKLAGILQSDLPTICKEEYMKVIRFFAYVGGLWFCVLFFGGVYIAVTSFHINDDLVATTEYVVTSDKVTEEFRVVQLSDLHDFSGVDNVVNAVVKCNPDLIVTTGDMFDANRPDLQKTISLYDELQDSLDCPILYCIGNHENSKPELLKLLKEELEKRGIEFVHNSVTTVNVKCQDINVIGIYQDMKYDKSMSELKVDNDNFNLILCHFPENFDNLLTNESLYYGKELSWDFDLILSGHAHGGQVRWKNKGLYAPNQGYFPKFTHGKYKVTDTETLIVNSGLGNSSFPIRINNPSEISYIAIKPTYKQGYTLYKILEEGF